MSNNGYVKIVIDEFIVIHEIYELSDQNPNFHCAISMKQIILPSLQTKNYYSVTHLAQLYAIVTEPLLQSTIITLKFPFFLNAALIS